MAESDRETVTKELLHVLSPSTVYISEPAVAMEQIMAMYEAIQSGGSGREIVSRYTSRSWELMSYYKVLAEGLGGEGLPTSDDAKMEHAEPLDRIMEMLALDGLAAVGPAVKALMHRMSEADVEDEDDETPEGSMIHFDETKSWHSVEYWKAEADGLNNPYGHKIAAIRIQK